MQNKKAEKEFFDAFVQKGEYDVFDERGTNRLLDELKKISRIDSNERLRILDVGCGTGAFTKRFAANGRDVFGVDISVKSAILAQTISPQCSFFAGDAEYLPFADNTLDVILLSGVLHHLPSMVETLTECFRTLRSGGCCMGFDPNGSNPAMWLYRSSKSPLATRKGWTENERLLVRDQISSAFENAGFQKVIVNGITGVTYQYVGSEIGMKLLGLYNIFENILGKIGLGNKYGSFLVSYGLKK